MIPAGLTKIAAAKVDGSWTALDAIEAPEISADLNQALVDHDGLHNFTVFLLSVKPGILEWIAYFHQETGDA